MTTQVNKNIGIRMQPNGRMYEAFYEGGGELPEELKGCYTTKRVLKADIESYLLKRDSKPKKKGSSNATAKAAGRAE